MLSTPAHLSPILSVPKVSLTHRLEAIRVVPFPPTPPRAKGPRLLMRQLTLLPCLPTPFLLQMDTFSYLHS